MEGFRIYFENETVFVDKETLIPVKNGNETVYNTVVGKSEILWKIIQEEKGITVTLEAKSDEPLRIKRIDSYVFEKTQINKTDRITFFGRSFTANETRYVHELGFDREYTIDCLGLFPSLDGVGVAFAGVSPFDNAYLSVVEKTEKGLLFSAKTEFTVDSLNNTELVCERVLVSDGVTVDEFLDSYTEHLGRSTFDMPKLTGWNTWDYYANKLKPEYIFENVDALDKLSFKDKLDYIVIDDGWQKDWGDWSENDEFACGIASVAQRILEKGFIPGIWMAPVVVRKTTKTFEEHPEWLLRESDGEPVCEYNTNYYLDPTIPEVMEFILKNYRYQYDAGYRLFKMDYVSRLLRVRRFHDPAATPYGVLKELVGKVKETLGSDAVILGCSLPLECGADIAPSMRIGVDIHNYFSHVRAIIQALQWSWMYNNRITRIDIDFLIVRGEETADDPEEVIPPRNEYLPPRMDKQTVDNVGSRVWKHGDRFNAVEAETWANLVAISGGNIFLSDRMSKLNEKGIEIIENSFLLEGENVRPVFLREDKRIASLWKGDKSFLIVNWNETPETFTVRIDEEFTSVKPFEKKDGYVTVSLLPHESFGGRYI